ncbi:hypothetical protein WMF37_14820 [Sorangium sp. So ce291]|uniref:hypothetical protein n=1 Tax=Sorangium sp. So ce291 TaxID=3133294 RepID=UPI003F5F0F11
MSFTVIPLASISTVLPFVVLTVTELGVMSPLTLPARSAYGTLATAARGLSSSSSPTVMPRNRSAPSKTSPWNGTIEPRRTEKKPSSNVIAWTSLQSGVDASRSS